MRDLKNDEFRSFKKGLRKCDRQKREMKKQITELTERNFMLREQNKKFF